MASIGSQYAPRVALERTASAIASARRAVLADRYAINSFAVEWRWFAELLTDRRRLARSRRARARAQRLLRTRFRARGRAAVRPRRRRGAGLVGDAPAQAARLLSGARHANAATASSCRSSSAGRIPMRPLGTPLVEREAAEPVIAAWLAHLAGNPALPGLLLLPLIAEDGPFAAALGAILRRAQMPCADFARHRRALLAPRRQSRALPRTRALGASAPRAAPHRAAAGRFGRAVVHDGHGAGGGCRRDRGFSCARGERLEGRKPAPPRPTTTKCAASSRARSPRSPRKARSRSIASCSTDAPSPPRSRCAAATPPGTGRPPMTRAFARYAPGMLLTAALTEELAENAAIARTDSCAAADNRDAGPHLERALGAVRSPDRGAARGAVCARPAGWRRCAAPPLRRRRASAIGFAGIVDFRRRFPRSSGRSREAHHDQSD